MGETYDDVLRQQHYPVPMALDRWVRKFGIEEEMRYSVSHPGVSWATHASPAEPSERNRALAMIDMCVGLFYPEDYSGDDFQDLFDDYHRNLDGIPPRNPRPILSAHADYLRMVQELGLPMQHFLEVRHRLMAEYTHRNRVARGELDTTFERYLQCRIQTIYAIHFCELWLLLEGLQYTPAERGSELLSTAETSASIFNALSNELYSYGRDLAAGTPNLVTIYSVEQGVTLSRAAEEIGEMIEHHRRVFNDANQRLAAADMSHAMRRTGHFHQRMMESHKPSKAANPGRYPCFTG